MIFVELTRPRPKRSAKIPFIYQALDALTKTLSLVYNCEQVKFFEYDRCSAEALKVWACAL